jgi:hypothetical protein
MGMIINIDEALKQRTAYNVLKEPLHAMMNDMQEAWEKKNPIDLIFKRGTLSGFQETYTSSIGFAHAFSETGDYAVGPIFNTAEGFAATYRSRTFQGGFIITQQTLEDGNVGRVRDDASAFTRRWHGDIVEYAMKSLQGGFGTPAEWTGGDGKVTKIKLESADTVDGKIDTATKNPLFSKNHKTVDREDGTPVVTQSNIFWATDATGAAPGITLGGNDAGQVAKLADFINQIITKMENCKDDNGKIAGVHGSKSIVIANDPRLKAAINTALSQDMLNGTLNEAYQRATVESTPYLNDIPQFANGVGFMIIDHEYNNANHGLEFTERIPFTLDVTDLKRPKGVAYDGRQRFDVNVATWRGVAYGYIGTAGTSGQWNAADKFEAIKVVETVAKPVTVVNAADIGA